MESGFLHLLKGGHRSEGLGAVRAETREGGEGRREGGEEVRGGRGEGRRGRGRRGLAPWSAL